MILSDLPHLSNALWLLGQDNGSNIDGTAVIPSHWEERATKADDELTYLNAGQVEALVMGEESKQRAVAKRAPNANEVVTAAFDDGELAPILMRSWEGAWEAAAPKSHTAAQ